MYTAGIAAWEIIKCSIWSASRIQAGVYKYYWSYKGTCGPKRYGYLGGFASRGGGGGGVTQWNLGRGGHFALQTHLLILD